MTNDIPAIIQNRRIILDSCIIQYLDNKYIRPNLMDFLRFLLLQNSKDPLQKDTLVISRMSQYELLAECPRQKEVDLSNILEIFPKYEISQDVLLIAARLATVYRFENNLEHKMISDGDKIIGATAILSGSLILTANANDFPRPFFDERYKKRISYQKQDKDHMICFYLFDPDLKTILDRLVHRP